MNQESDKKMLRAVVIVLVSIGVIIVWAISLRYNLQGGFMKKTQTAIPVRASGSLSEIDAKIKTLKEQFKISQEKINELIEKQK